MSDCIQEDRQHWENVFFNHFAWRSGQTLCSEPDGPAVEGTVRPHDQYAMHIGGKCSDCGAQA